MTDNSTDTDFFNDPVIPVPKIKESKGSYIPYNMLYNFYQYNNHPNIVIIEKLHKITQQIDSNLDESDTKKVIELDENERDKLTAKHKSSSKDLFDILFKGYMLEIIALETAYLSTLNAVELGENRHSISELDLAKHLANESIKLYFIKQIKSLYTLDDTSEHHLISRLQHEKTNTKRHSIT
jgi:hypothetical protein